MITEQNKLKYDHILIRFGELSTKGKNKKDFIRQLMTNVKRILKPFDKLTFERGHDRLFVILNGEDHDLVCERIKKVFGISSFSSAIKIKTDLDAMVDTSYEIAKQSKAKTFKIDCKRHFKEFMQSSDEINRACATKILQNTDLKVDVHEPDLRIRIEVREYETYVMTDKIWGAGGYPVGANGKALVMLSGGIDSPVACYEMMKRGVTIECIHYASPPYTSDQALSKVKKLAELLAIYQGHIRLHIIPFTEMQLAINANANESYQITVMRRMMYRIAQKVAEAQSCSAIVNGESLGQVASQTLASMDVIGKVVDIPVIRPIVCMDKLEIINIATELGTYETSILPYEDCCTIFTPKKPTTKPNLKKVEYYESKFDFEKLIEKSIQEMTSENMYFDKEKKEINEDLF